MGEKFINVFLSNLNPSDGLKEEIKIDDSQLYQENKTIEKIEARIANNLYKVVMAETPMGEPGAALIPTVWDGEEQKKKKKEEEKRLGDTVQDLTQWGEEQQKKLEEELKRIYKG